MRAISIVVVLEAAGTVLFVYALPSVTSKYAEALFKSALRLAIAAAILTLLQHLIAPARLAASFSGILDGSLQEFYLQSDAGTANGIRIFGMLAIGLGLTLKNRWVTLSGVALTCLSFVAMGHTTTHSPRWLLAFFLAIHISIIAFWFGSLRPLRRLADERPLEIAVLLEQFSRFATRAVPLLFIAGLVLSVALLGSFAKLLTPYGFMLIGKVAGFTLLIALASLNRWRSLPGIKSGQVHAIGTFRKTVTFEWLIIVGLIVATVSVTSLFSP